MSNTISKSWIPSKFYYGIEKESEYRYYPRVSYFYPVTSTISKNKKYEKTINDKCNKILELDNEPKSGFRINFIKGEWKIMDPRGFKIKLTNEVFSKLIDKCVIDNGEIISKCVWGWNRSPILISEEFDEYKEASKNKEKPQLSMKDLKPGNTFEFINDSSKYIYCGKHLYSNTKIKNMSVYYSLVCNYTKNKTRNIDAKYIHIAYCEKSKRFIEFTKRQIFNINTTNSDKNYEEVKSYMKDNKKGSFYEKKQFYYVQLSKDYITKIRINNSTVEEDTNIKKSTSDLATSRYRSYSLVSSKYGFLYNDGKFYMMLSNTNIFVENSNYIADLNFNSPNRKLYMLEIDIDQFNNELKKYNLKHNDLDNILNLVVDKLYSKEEFFTQFNINSNKEIFLLDMIIEE